MNKFLYSVLVILPCVTINCSGTAHPASAGFRFHNSCGQPVELIPVVREAEYEFKHREKQTIPDGNGIFFEESLANYEEFDTPEESKVILTVLVNVGSETVGHVDFIRAFRPNPRVTFETEGSSHFKLRIQCSKHGGGGPATLEIVEK